MLATRRPAVGRSSASWTSSVPTVVITASRPSACLTERCRQGRGSLDLASAATSRRAWFPGPDLQRAGGRQDRSSPGRGRVMGLNFAKSARRSAVEMTRRGKRGKLQRQKRVFPSFLRCRSPKRDSGASAARRWPKDRSLGRRPLCSMRSSDWLSFAWQGRSSRGKGTTAQAATSYAARRS